MSSMKRNVGTLKLQLNEIKCTCIINIQLYKRKYLYIKIMQLNQIKCTYIKFTKPKAIKYTDIDLIGTKEVKCTYIKTIELNERKLLSPMKQNMHSLKLSSIK